MNIIYTVLFFSSAFLGVFILYHFFFWLSYVLMKMFNVKEKMNSQLDEPRNKFAIIVPAHNEEQIIDKLLQSVMEVNFPEDKYELIIIADNCSDNTAAICREFGASVYERFDDVKRGKPYALNWILTQINIDSYDAFTIIDADTAIDKDYLLEMNKFINRGCEAIQGYFGILNPKDNWLTRLMIIPGVIKFYQRYAVKNYLGISCPLMGNGMCFSKSTIKKSGWNAYSLTENWEYYIQLLLDNINVFFAAKAVIYSHAVIKLQHGETQRKRWTRGIMGVFLDYKSRLLSRVFGRKGYQFADALLELLSPSYSMLFIWIFFNLLIGLLFYSFNPLFLNILWINGVFFIAQSLAFLSGMITSKAPLSTWLALVNIPFFLFWKLLITAKAMVSIRKNQWEKTDRKLNDS
jgi:cellulose synthase/poly-beta-1,6-N-acetylglucosamine synthase-like glycosyltransferase